MGYEIELEGSFVILPPLSGERVRYLRALAATRRVRRDETLTSSRADPARLAVGLPVGAEGALFTGAGGMLGQEGGGLLLDPGGSPPEALGILDFDAPPTGQPSLWCPWTASEDGRALVPSADGGRVEHPFEWLDYLQREVLSRWGCALAGKATWSGDAEDDHGELVAGTDGVRDEPRGRPKQRSHRERCARCGMSTPVGAWACRGCRAPWSKHAADADALMAQAADAARAGHVAEAVRLLSATLEALPWWALPAWERGRLLGMMGQPGAMEVMAGALERELDPTTRRGMRRALVRIHLQQGRAPAVRLESFRAAGRYAEGVEEARAVEDVGRELGRPDLLLDALICRARCTSGLGRDADALAVIEDALSVEPASLLALEMKGHLAFRVGASAVGEAALRRVLATAPEPRLWVELGVALGSLGRDADAEAAFDAALRLDPAWGRASYNKGHAALFRGDRAEAARCFDRATRDGRDPQAATLAARALEDLRNPLGRGS